jgi:serine/threonine protein kinase
MISETISHYRILQKLGAGGMGEVCLAEDILLDGKVAIEVMPQQLIADQQASKRLIRLTRTMEVVYARLDEKDKAFAQLEKMYDERDGNLTQLKCDPQWDNLRSDPRFDDLVRRVGIPQ